MSYTIGEIANLLCAGNVDNPDATIDWLLTEKRSLFFPEDTLYFALNNKPFGGIEPIRELYSRGVRNFVVESKAVRANHVVPDFSEFPGSNFLIVSDALKALQKLTEYHRNRFNIPVIGVTGSIGRLFIRQWLCQILSPDRFIVRSSVGDNSQISIPLSVWQINQQAELAILEASVREPGQMRALQSIINPTIGIYSSAGSRDKGKFLSVQEKYTEELSLLKSCDVVIYNADDEILSTCAGRTLLTSREIAWSRRDQDKPLFISSIESDGSHTVITYLYLGMRNSIRIPFIDEVSIESAINCLAASLYLMLPTDQIVARMEQLSDIPTHLEHKTGKNGNILIDDNLNSDLVSLEIALDYLGSKFQDSNLTKTVIVSDIDDINHGYFSPHKKLTRIINDSGINKIIAVGSEITDALAKIDIYTHFFPDTESLLSSGVLRNLHNEIILIKGKQKYNFRKVVEELEQKKNDTVLDINLTALIDNLNYFRSKLKPGVKTICMIKASAYGIGAEEAALAFQKNKVEYMGVALTEEGVELRKSGISTSIMVMNPEESTFSRLFKYKLEPEIYSFHILETIIREAEKEGITHFPIHIKIDTGMHRLGFTPEDIPFLIKRLKEQNTVIPRSVFSHLAASDEGRYDDFTRGQLKIFEDSSVEFQQAFTHRILRHIVNSSGIERFPESQYDMVRLGLGLYGVNPCDNSIIHNVATLKTTILQIRNVKAGETVGYSRKGTIDRDSRIAVLRIGYADGVNRHLGNRNFYCLINGEKAEYVGNICMDLCMVDVTDVPCNEGDTAIVFGDDLPVTLVADRLGTIPYEVLTSVSTRVKRIYFQK